MEAITDQVLMAERLHAVALHVKCKHLNLSTSVPGRQQTNVQNILKHNADSMNVLVSS